MTQSLHRGNGWQSLDEIEKHSKGCGGHLSAVAWQAEMMISHHSSETKQCNTNCNLNLPHANCSPCRSEPTATLNATLPDFASGRTSDQNDRNRYSPKTTTEKAHTYATQWLTKKANNIVQPRQTQCNSANDVKALKLASFNNSSRAKQLCHRLSTRKLSHQKVHIKCAPTACNSDTQDCQKFHRKTCSARRCRQNFLISDISTKFKQNELAVRQLPICA